MQERNWLSGRKITKAVLQKLYCKNWQDIYNTLTLFVIQNQCLKNQVLKTVPKKFAVKSQKCSKGFIKIQAKSLRNACNRFFFQLNNISLYQLFCLPLYHNFLQGFSRPTKFESKIVSPPFAPPTEISKFGSPFLWFPPLIFNIQVPPHPKFSTYV